MQTPNKTNVRIKPHFSIVAHSSNSVELRSGVWSPTSFSITDETNKGFLLPIAQALDGTLSPAAIAKKLNIPRTEIESLIDHLQQIGVIEMTPSTALDLYLEQFSPALLTANTHKKDIKSQLPIILLGDKELVDCLKHLLTDTFNECSISTVNHDDSLAVLLEDSSNEWLYHGLKFEKMVEHFKPWQGHFLVYLQKNINPPACIKLNRILYDLKISWIYAAIDGPFLFVGPTFNHNTPCFECFENKISMNVKDHTSYQKYKLALINQQVSQRKNLPLDSILKNLLISHIAMEVTNYSLTSCSFTLSKVLSIYLPTMEINFNEFLRHSTCKTCGVDHLRDSRSLYFDIHQLLDN